MPFKPGESGNPSGQQKEKKFLAALERASLQEDHKRLRQAAERLLTFAAKGQPWAIQMLADRFDGRPKQQIEAHDDQGRPLAIALIAYAPSNPLQLPAKDIPTPDIESPGFRH